MGGRAAHAHTPRLRRLRAIFLVQSKWTEARYLIQPVMAAHEDAFGELTDWPCHPPPTSGVSLRRATAWTSRTTARACSRRASTRRVTARTCVCATCERTRARGERRDGSGRGASSGVRREEFSGDWTTHEAHIARSPHTTDSAPPLPAHPPKRHKSVRVR